MLRELNILCGVAVVENAYEETCILEVIKGKDIPSREKELLIEAKKRMGHLLFDSCDILLVDYIGKDISGEGIDPNISGRFPTPYCKPCFHSQKMAILDLTEASHGNCYGIGLADVINKRIIEKSDLSLMYVNAVTNTVLDGVRIPMLCESDQDVIRTCISTCVGIDKNAARIIRIRNTVKLDEIMLSESFYEEIRRDGRFEIISEPENLSFDSNGNLLEL